MSYGENRQIEHKFRPGTRSFERRAYMSCFSSQRRFSVYRMAELVADYTNVPVA